MVATDSKVISIHETMVTIIPMLIVGDQGPTLGDNCWVVFQYLNKALNMTVSVSFNGVRWLVVFWNVQTWENQK